MYISGSIVTKTEKYVNEKIFFDQPNRKILWFKQNKFEKIIKKNRKKGLKAIIIRPTSIYGYGQNKFKLIFK